MDLRQLRHFVTVARFASFSTAADHLGVTQPALSKSIRTLEQSLGVRLLDRGPAGVRATMFGERLLGYGQLLLSLSEEAVGEIDALRGARRGSLHIGGMAAILRTIVPETLTRFLVSHPEVGVIVHDGLNDALFGALFAGKLDIAITARPTDMLGDDLEWRRLREDPVDIVAAPDHPLAARTRVPLADLVPYSWVVPPRPEPDRLNLDALFANAGLPKPKIAVETTSVVFLTGMVRRTHHLSYLTRPSLAGESDAESASLRPLQLACPTWTRTICATFRRKGVIRPTVLAFLRELEAACR